VNRPDESSAKHADLRETRPGETSADAVPRTRRRELLTKGGLGLAAVTVGVGGVLDLATGTAQATGASPGVFASSEAKTPAVKATGTNRAMGVDASSDKGTGVTASSNTGTGLAASSTSGLAGHFSTGNVQVDNDLTVTGQVSAGTLTSGAGAFTSAAAATPAASGTGTSGAAGVTGSSDSGTGVTASSSTGTGLAASSTSGLAGHFSTGNVQVDNDLTVTGQVSAGTLTSGPGTFTSASSSTPAVTAGNTSSGYAAVFTGLDQSTVATVDTSGNVFMAGNCNVTGELTAAVKFFVQAHPADSGKEIVYVTLEGGEAGTYVRGTGQLHDGKAVVTLPEHFGLVTAADGMTTQLTPRGEWLQLYVTELNPAQIVVREAQGKSGLFDYFISGVRKGYEHHEVIQPKRHPPEGRKNPNSARLPA
jgi:hypothetical protein